MKFIVLTDTHFVSPGQKLYGLDPAERLAAAIRVINEEHRDISFVIITGDLAHRGEIAAYELLKTTLSKLRVPAILALGNHDDRTNFRTVFTNADKDENGFVQASHVREEATFVVLDTLGEKGVSGSGELCRERLSFLERALKEAPTDRPLLLFQHHPPFDVGLPHMDRYKLLRPDEEWAVIEGTRRPDFMFMGHVHRPIGGSYRGVPFQIQRAINHQVAFDLVTSDFVPGTHEAPDYALVTVSGRDVVILQRSFLYDGPVFSLDDPSAEHAQSPSALLR